MKNIFRIKYIVEMVIATICVGVCAYWFYIYGIDVPAHLGNPMSVSYTHLTLPTICSV